MPGACADGRRRRCKEGWRKYLRNDTERNSDKSLGAQGETGRVHGRVPDARCGRERLEWVFIMARHDYEKKITITE
ncbi:hypothetical protein E2C01_055004 [Portunus trituberculatus]|uniref:Uncharacterized protein n=1 Tax=Portunus trituberculatus TaxID=210409 RepID=A0A5B7GTJ1_PORTR|nr:hypothetical protein [Portunus trituberculatus]